MASPENLNKSPALSSASADVQEKTRQRAYEIYEECGREDGHALDDWLRAKEQIADALRLPKAA